MKFKTSDVVTLNKHSQYFNEDNDESSINPPYLRGVIGNYFSPTNIEVTWPSGNQNLYSEHDLDMVEACLPSIGNHVIYSRSISEKMKNPNLVELVGQVVEINEEFSDKHPIKVDWPTDTTVHYSADELEVVEEGYVFPVDQDGSEDPRECMGLPEFPEEVVEQIKEKFEDIKGVDYIPMNGSAFVQFHLDTVTKMNAICKAKNQDYSGGGDVYAFNNFVESAIQAGGTVEQGFLFRMSDKMSRIRNLTQSGKQAVKDESIKDTLMDLANYSILMMGYLEDKRRKGL